MTVLEQYIITLQNLGLLDVMMPFLLIFTIAFAVLQKSMILGPKSQKFNKIVSLVLAFTAIVPHVVPGTGPDVVVIINRALPNVSLLMIASMMALLMIGVFGSNVNVGRSGLAGFVVLFSFIAVAYTFLASAGVLENPPSYLSFLVDPNTRSMLVAILVFGLVVWFITKEEGGNENGGLSNFFESLKTVYGDDHH